MRKHRNNISPLPYHSSGSLQDVPLLRSLDVGTKRGYRILQELLAVSEDREKVLEEITHPLISPGGNDLLCRANLPQLEEDFHLLSCAVDTALKPHQEDIFTVDLLTARPDQVGQSFNLRQLERGEEFLIVTSRQTLEPGLTMEIQVLNLTEHVLWFRRSERIGAATSKKTESSKKENLTSCETRGERLSSQPSGPRALRDQQPGVGNNLESCVATDNPALSTSVNLPESLSLPLHRIAADEKKTNQGSNECILAAGSIDLNPSHPSDSYMENISGKCPEAREALSEEKVGCLGTICYDESLVYSEAGNTDSSPGRSDRPQPEERNKYKVCLKLDHRGRKVSVKLRKCSITLLRLSGRQIEIKTRTGGRRKLRRREVWICSAKTLKKSPNKTNDPSRADREETGGRSGERVKVRTLLDPLQPMVSQLKRLNLLLPDNFSCPQTEFRKDFQNKSII